jgi:hypothetical protein
LVLHLFHYNPQTFPRRSKMVLVCLGSPQSFKFEESFGELQERDERQPPGGPGRSLVSAAYSFAKPSYTFGWLPTVTHRMPSSNIAMMSS